MDRLSGEQECKETKTPIRLANNGPASLVVMDAEALTGSYLCIRRCWSMRSVYSMRSCGDVKMSFRERFAPLKTSGATPLP